MSSFGPTASTNQATGNLTNVSGTANANSASDTGTGTGILNIGQGNVASGTNFFNTLLNGNSANTTSTLQPSIDQIRQGTSNTMQAVNTLASRGGGRSGTNYGLSYAPQQQIQSLFNGARTSAATTLPQIGLAQEGVGTNLLNIGNSALNTSAGASTNLADINQRQQQITNSLWGNLGAGLLGAATIPFGGGSAAGGLLGLLGSGGGSSPAWMTDGIG
jgi:hypothetical protein